MSMLPDDAVNAYGTRAAHGPTPSSPKSSAGNPGPLTPEEAEAKVRAIIAKPMRAMGEASSETINSCARRVVRALASTGDGR